MYKFWLHIWIVCVWNTMDANFLSIPIIFCRDIAHFQFVPLVAHSGNDYIKIASNIFVSSFIWRHCYFRSYIADISNVANILVQCTTCATCGKSVTIWNVAVSRPEIMGMLRKLASRVFETHTIQICNQNLYTQYFCSYPISYI